MHGSFARKATHKLQNLQFGIPFFFVYCQMRFLILGWSVGERKKKRKNKIGKGVWS